MMLEYQLKKQLDLANQQIELYKQLETILKNDVQKRDAIIAAQDRLIIHLQTVSAIYAANPVHVLMPPPPFDQFWRY